VDTDRAPGEPGALLCRGRVADGDEDMKLGRRHRASERILPERHLPVALDALVDAPLAQGDGHGPVVLASLT